MKKCPYCLAELHDAALVCSYCNSDVMVTVPLRVVAKQNVLEKTRKKNRFIALGVVGFSITVLIMTIVIVLSLLWNFY
jgi:hypothetical protein